MMINPISNNSIREDFYNFVVLLKSYRNIPILNYHKENNNFIYLNTPNGRYYNFFIGTRISAKFWSNIIFSRIVDNKQIYYTYYNGNLIEYQIFEFRTKTICFITKILFSLCLEAQFFYSDVVHSEYIDNKYFTFFISEDFNLKNQYYKPIYKKFSKILNELKKVYKTIEVKDIYEDLTKNTICLPKNIVTSSEISSIVLRILNKPIKKRLKIEENTNEKEIQNTLDILMEQLQSDKNKNKIYDKYIEFRQSQ